MQCGEAGIIHQVLEIFDSRTVSIFGIRFSFY
jgi:hypothetical protein